MLNVRPLVDPKLGQIHSVLMEQKHGTHASLQALNLTLILDPVDPSDLGPTVLPAMTYPCPLTLGPLIL